MLISTSCPEPELAAIGPAHCQKHGGERGGAAGMSPLPLSCWPSPSRVSGHPVVRAGLNNAVGSDRELDNATAFRRLKVNDGDAEVYETDN